MKLKTTSTTISKTATGLGQELVLLLAGLSKTVFSFGCASCVAAACLVFAGCTTYLDRHELGSSGLAVKTPNRIRMVKKAGDDFELYEFTKDAERLLLLYIGDHPSFPIGISQSDSAELQKLHGLHVQNITRRDGERLTREVLIALRPRQNGMQKGMERPGFVHMGYENLTSKNASLADEIISTIRTVSQRRLPGKSRKGVEKGSKRGRKRGRG